jgi:hypothetical protein
LNPRHQVLETCVLPTELTAQGDDPQKVPQSGTGIDDEKRGISGRSAA